MQSASLLHELAHPYLSRDWGGAPTWVDEGLASQFEGGAWGADGELHGRRDLLHEAEVVQPLELVARAPTGPVPAQQAHEARALRE